MSGCGPSGPTRPGKGVRATSRPAGQTRCGERARGGLGERTRGPRASGQPDGSLVSVGPSAFRGSEPRRRPPCDRRRTMCPPRRRTSRRRPCPVRSGHCTTESAGTRRCNPRHIRSCRLRIAGSRPSSSGPPSRRTRPSTDGSRGRSAPHSARGSSPTDGSLVGSRRGRSPRRFLSSRGSPRCSAPPPRNRRYRSPPSDSHTTSRCTPRPRPWALHLRVAAGLRGACRCHFHTHPTWRRARRPTGTSQPEGGPRAPCTQGSTQET